MQHPSKRRYGRKNQSNFPLSDPFTCFHLFHPYRARPLTFPFCRYILFQGVCCRFTSLYADSLLNDLSTQNSDSFAPIIYLWRVSLHIWKLTPWSGGSNLFFQIKMICMRGREREMIWKNGEMAAKCSEFMCDVWGMPKQTLLREKLCCARWMANGQNIQ